MTDWSSVEFAGTASKSKKAQDFLPIFGDLLAVWDFLACAMAGEGTLALYARYSPGQMLDVSSSGPFCHDILFGSLITSLILRGRAGALNQRLYSVWQIVKIAEQRCVLAFAVLMTVGFATRAADDLARFWLVSWFGVFALGVALTRLASGSYLHRLHGRGDFRESIAIVGASRGVRDRLAARVSGEADVVGLYDTPSGPGEPSDAPGGGDALADLLELGRCGRVDSVILALDSEGQADFGPIIEQLKALPIQVAVCPEDEWSGTATPHMRILGGLPMAVVADRPIKQWNLLIKTAFDRLGALILLVLLAPLFVGIAIAVWTTSDGPVIFRQKRQGWCGRDFTVFKFRTMRSTAACGRQYQTQRNDARCTSVGRILRQSSLDELPQLFNVLRGDMSLVGPRPHAGSLHDIDRAGHEIVSEYAQRHRVKPGITGWAQVNGARGATATLDQMRHRVEYDLFYIENWSIWLDLRILLRTPFCLSGDNAF